MHELTRTYHMLARVAGDVVRIIRVEQRSREKNGEETSLRASYNFVFARSIAHACRKVLGMDHKQ